MSLVIPKSAILATRCGPRHVSRQLRAAMSLQHNISCITTSVTFVR